MTVRSDRIEAVGLIAAVVVATLAGPRPGHALCAPGFQDAGGGVCTATLAVTLQPETLVLPPGVSVVTATLSGAEGGPSLEEQVDPFGGLPSPGGKGGRETAIIPVAPGATLTAVVGEAGVGGILSPLGYGGYGGGGHASSRYGGNGGGGSFLFDDNGPLLVAGGGGGGGYDYNPIARQSGNQQAPGGDGSGAAPAGDGQSVAFCCDPSFNPPPHFPPGGGGGATPTSPGVGGHPALPPGYAFGQVDGDAGSGPALDANNLGHGGDTHNGCCYYTGWAGGGGGGYYGGGGGGNIEADVQGGGGGGGAGYVTPAAVSSSSLTGVQAGDGAIVVSYFTGACDASCVTCSGPSSTECASCGAGLVLLGGACVTPPSSTATTTTTTTTTTTITTTTVVPPTTSTTGASTSTTTTVVSTTTTITMGAPLCGGAPVPSTACRLAAPRASAVQIKNDADKHKDLLKWKWAKGAATAVGDFRDPIGGTASYHLCVYDTSANAQPLMDVPVAPGGTCGSAPCWKALKATGFAYKNKAGTPHGITTVTLKAGAAGKASVQMKGKGALLPTTALGLSTPVTVQLVIGDGASSTCWQTTYTSATRNGPSQFGAKGP